MYQLWYAFFYFSEFFRNQYLHIYILKYIPLLCAYNISPIGGCNNIIYRPFYFGGWMWGLDRVVDRAGYTPGYPFRTDPAPCNLAFSRIRQFAQCKQCILYFYIMLTLEDVKPLKTLAFRWFYHFHNCIIL